jgi:cobalt/nickel transport system ATP-binding protein
MKAFELKGVSYAYRGGFPAVDDVTFSVDEGQSLTIIGANGSGKSTLLYIMNGLIMPDRGVLTVLGQKIRNSFPVSLRQRVSLLFQNSQAQLFSLSVWDELCYGPIQLGLGTDEIDEKAEAILRILGIEHLRDRGPWDLSAGEMKKAAMGACLSTEPDMLLLDEPTTGLDPKSQVEITDLIIRLKEAGKTIITATHDLHIIEDISERTIVIDESHRVLLDKSPWETLEDHETLLRANLIHKHLHRHSWYVHEHPHHSAHEHGHIIKENLETIEEAKKSMDDKEKLKKLIEHWREHNSEHASTYREWAKKAGDMGNESLASILEEIAKKTTEMGELFKRGERTLQRGD